MLALDTNGLLLAGTVEKSVSPKAGTQSQIKKTMFYKTLLVFQRTVLEDALLVGTVVCVNKAHESSQVTSVPGIFCGNGLVLFAARG